MPQICGDIEASLLLNILKDVNLDENRQGNNARSLTRFQHWDIDELFCSNTCSRRAKAGWSQRQFQRDGVWSYLKECLLSESGAYEELNSLSTAYNTIVILIGDGKPPLKELSVHNVPPLLEIPELISLSYSSERILICIDAVSERKLH